MITVTTRGTRVYLNSNGFCLVMDQEHIACLLDTLTGPDGEWTGPIPCEGWTWKRGVPQVGFSWFGANRSNGGFIHWSNADWFVGLTVPFGAFTIGETSPDDLDTLCLALVMAMPTREEVTR